MYTIFIIFFASLLGIMAILGRKVVLIRNGMAAFHNGYHPLLPDVIKIRQLISFSLKRLSYIIIVVSLRLYFRLVNFLKAIWMGIRIKISQAIAKHSKQELNASGTREASGFLKMMSEYKSKVRTLKHRIKEEESE